MDRDSNTIARVRATPGVDLLEFEMVDGSIVREHAEAAHFILDDLLYKRAMQNKGKWTEVD